MKKLYFSLLSSLIIGVLYVLITLLIDTVVYLVEYYAQCTPMPSYFMFLYDRMMATHNLVFLGAVMLYASIGPYINYRYPDIKWIYVAVCILTVLLIAILIYKAFFEC